MKHQHSEACASGHDVSIAAALTHILWVLAVLLRRVTEGLSFANQQTYSHFEVDRLILDWIYGTRSFIWELCQTKFCKQDRCWRFLTVCHSWTDSISDRLIWEISGSEMCVYTGTNLAAMWLCAQASHRVSEKHKTGSEPFWRVMSMLSCEI